MVVGYCVDPDNPLGLDALWPEHRSYVSLVFEEEHYLGSNTADVQYDQPLKPLVWVFLVRHPITEELLCVRINDSNGNYSSTYRYKYLSLKKLDEDASAENLLYYEL